MGLQGLNNLYQNTKVLKTSLHSGSALINGATRRSTFINLVSGGLNESLMIILAVGASNQGKAAPGTVRITALQSPSTNGASYTHVNGSTMRRTGPNTIAATPIKATQKFLKIKASVIVGGTSMHFAVALVGTGRNILPLSTK